MNEKEFIKKIKTNEKQNKKKNDSKWLLLITTLSFIISILFSLIAESIMPNVNIIIAIIVMFIFIIVGVIFDILGVSVTSADIKPYHSMASKKIKGAKVAVNLKQNADKVSNVFCDVIGDICGIISGSAGVYVAVKLSNIFSINAIYPSIFITGIISCATIGGKALGKGYAINNGTTILYNFSKLISIFNK